jgi:uncharacterized membrane protein YkoI
MTAMSGKLAIRGMHMALCAVLLLSLAGPGRADGDHDRARRALEAGEVLPLRTILQRVEREHPGRIMEVELEDKDNRWLYEIKLLRSDGTLVKLKIDARDGSLLGEKVKGKSAPHRQEAP